jgi:hypothetical protein
MFKKNSEKYTAEFAVVAKICIKNADDVLLKPTGDLTKKRFPRCGKLI